MIIVWLIVAVIFAVIIINALLQHFGITDHLAAEERSFEELQETYPIFMAGYRLGSPCEGDAPPPADIDRRHPDFKRGLRAGRRDFERLRKSHPHMIINGVIREDPEA